MRTILVLLVGLAVLPSALAARVGTSAALSMSVSSHKVLYSHRATLSGKLTGGLVAGRAVIIDAWTYGRSAPHALATVISNIDGGRSFRVKPGLQTPIRPTSARPRAHG